MLLLTTMIVALKMVPEAMMYPISQLIPSLHVIVHQESNAIFAIDSSARMSLALGKWEM